MPRLFSAPTYRHLLSAALIQRSYLQALAQRRACSAPHNPPGRRLFFTARTCSRRRACSYLTAQSLSRCKKRNVAAEKSKCPRPVFLYCGGSNGPFGSAFPERKCCTMEIGPLENKRTCLAGQRSFQSSEWKDTSKRTHSSRLTSLSGVLCLLVFLKVGTSNSGDCAKPWRQSCCQAEISSCVPAPNKEMQLHKHGRIAIQACSAVSRAISTRRLSTVWLPTELRQICAEFLIQGTKRSNTSVQIQLLLQQLFVLKLQGADSSSAFILSRTASLWAWAPSCPGGCRLFCHRCVDEKTNESSPCL